MTTGSNMFKPTIFFSHSSKDKDAILSIKTKIDYITGGALDIFMSSDGQSIPFGTNWIHKVEEGLQSAKIMFAFITNTSIASGWIYFETGYAYSKKIQVIPVGIGIDIGALKAPLNLLQGFNITSEDSLNNFISIINNAFNYHFPEAFGKNDYLDIMRLSMINAYSSLKFENIVHRAECSIYPVQSDDTGSKEYDLELCFGRIINYLDENSIKYSCQSSADNAKTCVMVYGIKIEYTKEQKGSPNTRSRSNVFGEISFHISPYNFSKSFNLLKNFLLLVEDKPTHFLKVYLQEPYNYITVDEDCASIVSDSDGFDFDKSQIGGYYFKKLGLEFYILKDKSGLLGNKGSYLMSIVYKCDDICADHIEELLYNLCEIGLIRKEY